tara:strand:- start:225 stop:692 length:468 start_codon:yes stop_codon:yes gene_type:complete
MLKRTNKPSKTKATGLMAIVASAYNAKYVDAMLDAALNVLGENGAEEVEIIRVPGAFEIPLAAAKLARRKRKRPIAIICLGLIIRGETVHAEHIGATVSRLLGEVSVETGVPVIHEVLLLENEAQARKRCINKTTNRGAEAAHTALKMGQIIQAL